MCLWSNHHPTFFILQRMKHPTQLSSKLFTKLTRSISVLLAIGQSWQTSLLCNHYWIRNFVENLITYRNINEYVYLTRPTTTTLAWKNSCQDIKHIVLILNWMEQCRKWRQTDKTVVINVFYSKTCKKLPQGISTH